ncbi:MAG: NUDIX hydrolase [Candidatus Pelagibacter sp.]|nr:NUDIX hydrolase [Candidatus Pelagibacter sp.]
MRNIKLTHNISLINKKFKKDQYYHYLTTSNLSLIIPKINNRFILVSQKKIPINKVNYEFPSGIIEKKETALISANKELLEETGYKSNLKLKKITSFFTEPGRLTTTITGFYTDNISQISKPENGIKLLLATENQILNFIKIGKFNNASHIAMFYFLKNKYA